MQAEAYRDNSRIQVPQGGVLIFINDIQKQISKRVFPSLYADDLAPLCTEEGLGTAKARLQTTLNTINKWTTDWGLSGNKTKTTYTIFTFSTKKCNVRLGTNGCPLQKDDNPTYIRQLTQMEILNRQIPKKRDAQDSPDKKKLAGSKWDANYSILKKTYLGYVRPVLEYGISSWGQTASSNLHKI
ncbi:hypothetical protein RRG08_012924 [Elysia crispata]|uniref:Reverse transcriptase domain-containing protein n=1 Tax=Elysia crispata TaxID=231223 RepID=A0AAE1DQ13_9GAST|nr:hypothetical protein RRG08_012924 [Elysia crispata]